MKKICKVYYKVRAEGHVWVEPQKKWFPIDNLPAAYTSYGWIRYIHRRKTLNRAIKNPIITSYQKNFRHRGCWYESYYCRNDTVGEMIRLIKNLYHVDNKNMLNNKFHLLTKYIGRLK